MDGQVTKKNFMEVAMRAILSRETEEFMALLSARQDALVAFLAEDSSFCSAFQVQCLRIANISSLTYTFLAGLNLVSLNRPTTFATVCNQLFVCDSTRREHQIMLPVLAKVKILLFLLCLVQPVESVTYSVNSIGSHLVVTSDIATEQYLEMSELFSLDLLTDQQSKVRAALETIKSFMEFSVHNSNCQIGNLNSNTDEFDSLVNLVKKKNLTRVMVQHREPGEHKYAVFIHNTNGRIECKVSHSLHSIQFMLARNNLRLVPRSELELVRYRDAMLSLFKDVSGKDCIRHGAFDSNKFVSTQFYLDSPKIETCSAICHFQHQNFLAAQKQQLLFDVNLNASNCDAWSFDIKSGTCFLMSDMPAKVFLEEIDFKNIKNRLVLSGTHACVVKDLYSVIPKVFIKGELTDLKNMCSFSKENLIFQSYNVRCKNLYSLLNKPLLELQQELQQFEAKFVSSYKLRIRSSRSVLSTSATIEEQLPLKTRTARSLIPASAMIVNSLLHAAKRTGASLLQNIVQTGSQNGIELLSSFSQRIRDKGLMAKVINKKIESNVNTIDVSQYLDTVQKLRSSNVSVIVQDYVEYLHCIQFASKAVMQYYSLLMTKASPVSGQTLAFVKEHSFIFTAYITNNKVVRQFVKQVPGVYTASMVSVIPLGNYFYNTELWQSDKFFGTPKESLNQCILALMQGKNIHDTESLCKSQDQLSNFRKMRSTEVFFMLHQFDRIEAKILVVNMAGLIDINCVQGRILRSISGLSIFLISKDCNVQLTGNLLFTAVTGASGFEPKMIYNSSTILQSKVTFKYSTLSIINASILGVGFVFCCFLLICIQVKIRCDKRIVLAEDVKRNEVEMELLPVD